MKAFIVLSALVALGACAPAPDADAQFGPYHPAHGPFVATKRGYANVALEGFSEDDNMDGYVDPIAQVAPYHLAPAVHHVAPAVHHIAPAVHHIAPVVKTIEPVKVEVKEVKPVEIKTPVISYAAPVHHVVPAVHHVATPVFKTVAVPTVEYKQTQYTHTIPVGHQVQHYTTHHVGAPLVGSHLLPALVKPVEEAKPAVAEE